MIPNRVGLILTYCLVSFFVNYGVEANGQEVRDSSASQLDFNSAVDLIRARKELRDRQKEAVYEERDSVRVRQHAWAHFTYPTSLLKRDFPSVSYGLTYVNRGRIGLAGTVGLLTAPGLVRSRIRPELFGRARHGLRGIELALEGRYYVSDLHHTMLCFLGVGVSGALAPVLYETYLPNFEQGYRQFAEVSATGKEYHFKLVVGWDGRFRKNVALEASAGVAVGQQGLFAQDPKNNFALDPQRSANSPIGRWQPYIVPFIRIGVGLGYW